MKSVDTLVTDCVREFNEWLAKQSDGQSVPSGVRSLLLQAFVAGYERGGVSGAQQMYTETLSVLREAQAQR